MMKLNLSEIQIIPTKPKDGLLAFASFVVNNSFFVGDVAIYTRLNREGYRLVYPMKILQNGLKINCFHPITRQVAESIENQVIGKYLVLIEKVTKMKGRCEYECGMDKTSPSICESLAVERE